MTAPRFPTIVSGISAQILHMERQFAAFEKLPRTRQDAISAAQIDTLLRHARAHSAFWAGRLPPMDKPLRFEDLPVLTRGDIQAHGEALRCSGPMPGGKRTARVRTSGSTGRPVEVLQNAPLYGMLYTAQFMRGHRWHGVDPRRDAVIFRDEPDCLDPSPWGKAFAELGRSGTGLVRNHVERSPEALWEILRQQTAPYLVASPAVAGRLAELAMAEPGHGRRIDMVLTFGEVVTPELREAAREAFGARVIDRYSCEEAGWIAVQCPRHEHLHAMSATVHVEVVGPDNRPVKPGEEGRVLITPLHAYAMPLVRYDIGDRAVAGGACDCGINLPVIGKIVGRERGFIVLPDGSSLLPRLTGEFWRDIAPVAEYRVVQYGDGLVEAFVTAARPLDEAELAACGAMLRRRLHQDLSVLVTQVEAIDWPSRWKRVDVSRVDWLRGEAPSRHKGSTG